MGGCQKEAGNWGEKIHQTLLNCSYICCNYTLGNLWRRYNVFDPLISQSISPVFWKETPLKPLHRIFWNNPVPLFFKEFWLFQFRILLFQNKDQSTGIWWKLRWDDFGGGSYAPLLNYFVCLMHTLPFIMFLVVK